MTTLESQMQNILDSTALIRNFLALTLNPTSCSHSNPLVLETLAEILILRKKKKEGGTDLYLDTLGSIFNGP